MKYYVLVSALFSLIVLFMSGDAVRSSAQSNLKPDYQLLVKSLSGDEGGVKFLLNNGVDPNTPPGPNDKGMTAIIFASMKGYTKIVQMLANAGADVNARSNTGTTPLMYAALNNDIQSARLLLQQGANADIQEQNEGMTALMYAIKRGHFDIVKILSKEPLNTANEIRTFNGDTTLLTAVKTGNLQIVDALLESNPDLEARDQFNQTPLMNAARKGFTRIVIHLLNKGAQINAVDSNGQTALVKATIGNHQAIIQVLRARTAR